MAEKPISHVSIIHRIEYTDPDGVPRRYTLRSDHAPHVAKQATRIREYLHGTQLHYVYAQRVWRGHGGDLSERELVIKRIPLTEKETEP